MGVLILASSYLILVDLGRLPLIDWDEAIYADVAKNTLATGNWLTLTRFGESWFEKPPLYIWLVMASIKTLGTSEFALRLPSAILSVAAILLLYFLVLELSGSGWLSFLTALILLFSSPFYLFGRQSRVDVPVTAAIIFSVLCFIKGKVNKKWLLGLGAGIGIGILFKSVIGLIAFLPVFAYSTVYHEWRWVKEKYMWIGFGLAALIVAPWHIYETAVFGGQFWNQYLVTQVLRRAVTDMQGMTNFDYLRSLWLFYRPWSLAAIALVPLVFLNRRQSPSANLYRRIMLFGFVSSVFIFSFFAVARTKMWVYLIPMFPFVAIFISAGLYDTFKDPILSARTSRALLSATVVIVLLLGAVITVRDTFINLPRYYFPYVYDEKIIGEYLRNRADAHPVFLYKWQLQESLEFYSGRILQAIKSLPSAAAGLSYLIINSNYLDTLYNQDLFYKPANEIYVGPYLALLRVP